MLIHNITWINQNMQVASTVAADYVAREVISREVQKITNAEKQRKIEDVKEVEEVEKILPEDDSKEKIEREIKHIDLKA